MTERTEAEKIRDIKNWPWWPWLPVKGPDYKIGVVFADDIDLPSDTEAPITRLIDQERGREPSGPIRVWDANLFGFDRTRAALRILAGSEPWPLHGTYTDVEALIDAGWRGD
jgi:hypothetical protein